MASVPLGKNITYKPGKKMVKIVSDPKTYAVSKGGILRWVRTESVAKELYGFNWNTKVDDVDVALFAGYTLGTDVTSTADFNPAAEEASVTYPSDSLNL